MYYESKRCGYENCDAPVMMYDDYGMTGRLCRYHYYKWLEYEEERKAEEERKREQRERTQEQNNLEREQAQQKLNQEWDRKTHNLLYELEHNPESLKQIKELSIDLSYATTRPYNKTTLPDSIGSLTNLKELSILNLKNLEKLPDSIGNLKNLKELRIHGSKLKELPDSIGNLKSLKKLSLINLENLKKLPDSIGNLTQLTQLDLYNSKVTSIPDSINNCTRLTSLDLRGNELTDLPKTLNLDRLTHLNLSNNKLTTIPDVVDHFHLPENCCVYVRGNQFPYKHEYFKIKEIKGIKDTLRKQLEEKEEKKIKKEEQRKINQLKRTTALERKLQREEEWEKIKNSNSISDFETYLKNYSRNSYTNFATQKIEQLKRAAELQREREDREKLVKFITQLPTKATDLAGDAINQLSQSEAIKKAKDLIDKEELSSVAESLKTEAVETITKLSNRFKNWKL
jgi:Leucine-rich repeat (LRR) protein